MTMLLPLFILVGFIAGYFVNAIAYHLSPLEDKTALTFRQVLVHFRQKKYAWHDTVPLILCVAAAIACALAPFTPIVTGALFLYFCFVLTLSVIDFRTMEIPDGITPKELQQKVMKEAEWIILPKAIDMIADGQIPIGE